MKTLQQMSIARVSTVPFYVVTQLNEQIEACNNAGANVSVISSPVEPHLNVQVSSSLYEYIPINIPRQINLYKDMVALIRLYRLFRARRFDIVHSTTPKAGLLCAIAGKMAGIQICLHTFTGQTWVTLKGFKKHLLRLCDWIIGRLNTRCYADSFGQKKYLITQHIVSENKLLVLGNGSLAGVNLERFSPAQFSNHDKQNLRASLKIAENALIVLFVGRLTKDKGIFELVAAFEQIIKSNDNVYLLFVGPIESDLVEEFPKQVANKCGNKVVFVNFTKEPEKYMAISTLLCLPSYREGFGTVVIEAAAMGLPTVGTKIYGLADAVVDQETGILVEPKNTSALQHALEQMIINNELCVKMGQNARQRVIDHFDSKVCNNLLIDEYANLFNELSLPIS